MKWPLFNPCFEEHVQLSTLVQLHQSSVESQNFKPLCPIKGNTCIIHLKNNLQVVQPLLSGPDIVQNDIRSTNSAQELTCSTEPYCLREKTPRLEMSSLADELKQ
ncbi:jg12716 [Pararge aegeria aegeria]|uniref:Jg12716 protein n=1 Tax=Pararge aegeria aegeria TaxID=348720 RepID=A0A8S4RYF6_9NEOP|nr:jg12716 [Pararge aegeria aegeria]